MGHGRVRIGGGRQLLSRRLIISAKTMQALFSLSFKILDCANAEIIGITDDETSFIYESVLPY